MRVDGRSIAFRGDGPFDLRATENVIATSRGSGVVISFEVQISASRREVVRIAFPSNQARRLANEIRGAVAKIGAARKPPKHGEAP